MTTSYVTLAAVRTELDRIDDSILDLIERRLAASKAIAALKDSGPTRHLKIRPRRQAAILARLQANANLAAPQLIADIWRELMAHCLQAQERTDIVISPACNSKRVEALVRAHFGSAPPLRWAASSAEALSDALNGDTIAILPHPLSDNIGGLRIFDTVCSEDGTPVAYAVGPIAEEDISEDVPAISAAEVLRPAAISAPGWSPESWRGRLAAQMPAYPDADAAARVERRLAGSAPLVRISDIIHLRAALARVAGGGAFVIQAGDCAESFAEFNAEKVRTTYELLLRMGAMLRAASGTEVVHLARIAGQFAKPRSAPTETVDGTTLPVYRGDAVNGPAFTQASRTPDPGRLLEAHRQARVTIELLHAYASASYVDLPAIHQSVGLTEPIRHVPMFTSHEALLLNYEQALTRWDEVSESWWATSGHMIWIGERTRSLDGAHVEFARGVSNPVGLKCGPTLEPDDLLQLMDRLDPENRKGRLVLIGRFGAGKAAERLPQLMRAVRREGRNAAWFIDPMHGNTHSVGGLKTRAVADIISELRTFFEAAQAEGVHPGGVHLEMTGSDVTECLGGSVELAAEDLPRRYLTHCDPRLNADQALDVAAEAATLIADRLRLRSNAA